jgi:hypothetical protein
MLLSMAFTNDQLSKIESAIAQGALTVKYADRLVTYHSVNEMMRLRDTMRAELGVSVAAGARMRRISLATGKGL